MGQSNARHLPEEQESVPSNLGHRDFKWMKSLCDMEGHARNPSPSLSLRIFLINDWCHPTFVVLCRYVKTFTDYFETVMTARLCWRDTTRYVDLENRGVSSPGFSAVVTVPSACFFSTDALSSILFRAVTCATSHWVGVGRNTIQILVRRSVI